jgi:uncharacterized RDD family membrane protein YckC
VNTAATSSPVTAPPVPAGAVPRLIAFGIDVVLALAAAVAVHGAFLRGWLPGLRSTGSEAVNLLQLPSTWALTLLLVAVRDVPCGASFAKWMLCLRVVDVSGRPLSWPLRLLRAPLSTLPLEWLAGERRAAVPWRVTTYAPGGAGFVLRVCLALVAASWSVVWGVASVRPSIGRRDAVQLVEQTLGRDPLLQRALGAPLQFDITAVTPRSRTGLGAERGEFAVRVRGSARRQEMRVHALKVEGRWVIDELVDIQAARLASSNPPDTLVVR